MSCKIAKYHEPNETCSECGLETDDYANTEQDFINCSFPDCGCDGARLCMAPNGANADSLKCNVEGMYRRSDKEAVVGKMRLYALVNDK